MKPTINYLYFGLYFSTLMLFVASSIFVKDPLVHSRFFFLFYGFGQVFLETLVLLFVSCLIRRYGKPIHFSLFIGFSFFLLGVHFCDFLMDRILSLSAWEAFRIFVLEESWTNFLFLLEASGISLVSWLLIFVTGALIPVIGLGLYHLLEKITKKKALVFEETHLLQAAIIIPVALVCWDFSASSFIHPDAYTAFRTSLPWKRTFLQPSSTLLSLKHPLSPAFREKQIQVAIHKNGTKLLKKPNIYLFITESLRESAIQKHIAPNLFAFKNQSTHFQKALSGANATHISWFSIFHSELPLYWKLRQEQNWKMGSPALALLKKWGYQIHLFSSAEIGYYQMRKALFGENDQLLTTNKIFPHTNGISAADTDTQAIDALLEKVNSDPKMQEGQIFLIFWDGTHFDYSWPKNWTPPFSPFAKEFAYFKAFYSEQTIQEIKNRYHNAVHYVDTLFGKFLSSIPKKEEAIIVFTADHGEEFFEKGHLFHTSHLSNEQIHVPLYAQFGEQRKKAKRTFCSHIDIFPSIIDYLTQTDPFFLKGISFFSEHLSPYAMSARFNAGHSPYEFSLYNGENRVILQFSHPKEFTSDKTLKIVSTRNGSDQSIEIDVQKEFQKAFSKLFVRP